MSVAGGEMVIGVLGAGTMGAGIAQVAAMAGHRVIVGDARAEAVERARAGVERALDRLVEKGRLATVAAREAARRLEFVSTEASLGSFAPAGLVIEAIVEDLAAKREAFRRLHDVLDPRAILATNTSSLSITAIAADSGRPARVVGIHFFNPAPVLPLVEIVPGLATDPAVVDAATGVIDSWGKTTVVASDTPGFIVNRIARPFYSEALRIYEEGVADRATIDWAMREAGGFAMGPFELMDLIGNDVNLAVTHTVFAAMGYDPRYRPSITQQRLVEAGHLGRKSGQGHFDHRPGATRPAPTEDRDAAQAIVRRILVLLINAAADALFFQVATRDAIDLAMTKGVNYPKGLLRWADELGIDRVLEQLEQLAAEYGAERYQPSPLLRRMAREGRRFYA